MSHADQNEPFGEFRSNSLINHTRRFCDASGDVISASVEHKSGLGSDDNATHGFVKRFMRFESALSLGSCAYRDRRKGGATAFGLACEAGNAVLVDAFLDEARHTRAAWETLRRGRDLYKILDGFIHHYLAPASRCAVRYQQWVCETATTTTRCVIVTSSSFGLKFRGLVVAEAQGAARRQGVRQGDRVLAVGAVQVRCPEHFRQEFKTRQFPFRLLFLVRHDRNGRELSIGATEATTGASTSVSNASHTQPTDTPSLTKIKFTERTTATTWFDALLVRCGWVGFRGVKAAGTSSHTHNKSPTCFDDSIAVDARTDSGAWLQPKRLTALLDRLLARGVRLDVPPEFMARAVAHTDYDALIKAYHKPRQHSVASVAASNVDLSNYDGETPLMLAAHAGHLYIVKRLVEHRASLHLRSDAGWTPAMYAADNGHIHVLWYLWASLDDGHWDALAAPHSKGGARSVLSLSVIGGHLECVQFIVEHLYEGGNTTQETVDEKLARLEHLETMRTRRSPAMLALYHGKREIFSYLLSKGFRCAIRVDSPVRKHTASATHRRGFGSKVEGDSGEGIRVSYLHPDDVKSCPTERCPWPRDKVLSPRLHGSLGLDAMLSAWKEGLVLRERRVADWSLSSFQSSLSAERPRQFRAHPRDHLIPSPHITSAIIRRVCAEARSLAARGAESAAAELLFMTGPRHDEHGSKAKRNRQVRAHKALRAAPDGVQMGGHRAGDPASYGSAARLAIMAAEIRRHVQHFHDVTYALSRRARARDKSVAMARRSHMAAISRSFLVRSQIAERSGNEAEALRNCQIAFQFNPEGAQQRAGCMRLAEKVMEERVETSGRFHCHVYTLFIRLIEAFEAEGGQV